MASIKFIMGKRGDDERAAITLRLTVSNAKKIQTRVPGIQVFREYWSDAKQRNDTTRKFVKPWEVEEMEIINKTLTGLSSEVIGAIASTHEEDVNKEWLDGVIDKYLHPLKYAPKVEKPKTLMEAVTAFIEAAEVRTITQRTKYQYGQLRDQLNGFLDGGDIDTNELNKDFYNSFVDYLYRKGYKGNTVGFFIKNLKAVINSLPLAQRAACEFIQDRQCKKVKEEISNIYLNEEELRKIAELDLSGHLDKARDQFLLLCWTGCRYSDLGKLSKENIVTMNSRDYFKIEQQKTKATPTIPIFPAVRAIMEKYEYSVPKPMSDQKLNSYIKEVAKRAKLNAEVKITHTEMKDGKVQRVTRKYKQWECVKVHTARRSFATNLYKRGFPALMIMRITGHQTEKAFLSYLKVTEDENAEMMLKQFEEMEKRVNQQ